MLGWRAIHQGSGGSIIFGSDVEQDAIGGGEVERRGEALRDGWAGGGDAKWRHREADGASATVAVEDRVIGEGASIAGDELIGLGRLEGSEEGFLHGASHVTRCHNRLSHHLVQPAHTLPPSSASPRTPSAQD